MTRRERVIKAVNHQETDFVPYTIGCTTQAAEKVIAYTKDPHYLGNTGSHIEMLTLASDFTEVSPGFFKDEFSVVWNRTGADRDIGVIERIEIPRPDIALISLPEPDEAKIRQSIETFVTNQADTFKMAAIGFSMFERAWSLCSMENLLVYMLTDEEFADTLFDRICEYNLKIIDIVLEYDVDCFHFGDDWGQQKGLIMGPKLWRRFIKPRMSQMFKRVKAAGKYVSLHSCGDINEVFPDLIEIGLDIYNTFQPEIYNIVEVKRVYGDKLTFWGGISTQQLLPFAAPEELITETKRIISVLSVNGGYVLAPTHSIPQDVPPENIVALTEFFKNQTIFDMK